MITGRLRLDGGAMFGVVPKTLWSHKAEADELNRISLATRTLLAVDRSRGRVLIADTGCGSKWTREMRDRFAIEFDEDAIARALSSFGLGPDAVTDVIITHLHFDHAGGLTKWRDRRDGPTELVFPGAKHWVHREHWAHAHDPTPKDLANFVRADFAGLADSDALCLIEGDAPTCPIDDVEWLITHGHTPYQLHPVLGSGDERLLFLADTIPTIAHLSLPWNMAYDNQPLVTIQEKQAILQRCTRQNLLLAFPHDPEVGGVAVDASTGRAIVTRTLDLDPPS